MKLNIALALIAAAGLALAVAPASAQDSHSGHDAASPESAASKLPLRRITLYRSGVGAFERRGLIEGGEARPSRNRFYS